MNYQGKFHQVYLKIINKERDFKLVGIPDLVIKFTDKTYGIIDFKTTKISEKKLIFINFN